jgi:hypothetical protein
MQVGKDLGMDRDDAGARPGERLEISVRLGHHQVDVQGQPGHTPHRGHHRRADGEVRHEMPVHHVEVDLVGAAPLDRGDSVAESGKVGRQD